MGGGKKDVGVGTLAGSTISLLTIPWSLAVFLAKRDIDPVTGEAAVQLSGGSKRPKYTGFTWTQTGITTFANVPHLAKIMMVRVHAHTNREREMCVCS